MPNNTFQFRVWGRYALFCDPLTRIGTRKRTYLIPTYEALKGIAKSIYCCPTFVWIIDRVRVLRAIRTQSRSVSNLNCDVPGCDLSVCSYLTGDSNKSGIPRVEYQVQAHCEWNLYRPELARDRIAPKHFEIAQRRLELGGSRDIFLGTRDCQGYVEPCIFGSGKGDYDDAPDNIKGGLSLQAYGVVGGIQATRTTR